MYDDILGRWLWASRLANVFCEPDRWLEIVSPQGEREELRREYGDLFWGTHADIYIPLWASVCKYEGGCLLDGTTLEVLRFCHRWGYAPVELDGHPPDFIGQQLRFLCYLAACALHAREHGLPSALYEEAAEEFTDRYLLDTVRVVAAGIRAHARSPVLRALAEELTAFCAQLPTPAAMGSPEELRGELLCWDAYENGPSPAIPEGEARAVQTAGRNNCGGKCSIRATVQEGCLLHLETGCGIGDPELRACVRGMGYRSTYLTGRRLRYPMKRIGKRDEGRFCRIGWEEAAGLIAGEWRRIAEAHGPGSRYANYATGVSAVIRPDALVKRLFNLDGGCLGRYGTYSSACATYVTPYIYGDIYSGSSSENLLHSRLILLWGHNPAETKFSTNTTHILSQARERGARVVVIDPRQSDTALSLADEWIPIRPSTDGALAAAMAHVIWSEGLLDRAFLDRFCLGFDAAHMPEGAPAELNYENYLSGGLDGIPKTPEWGESVTGVPAATIRRLAREYATAKPACLLPGLGNQRTGNGEQTVRAMAALTCMTGNVGVLGGGAAGAGMLREEASPEFPTGKSAYPGVISCFLWLQAVEEGRAMTRERDHIQGMDRLDAGIKLLFNLGGNTLINQHSDINRTAAVLRDESKCEFLVCSDVFMTPSARFADLLLPAPSFLEEENISRPWRGGHYLLYNAQVIKPLFGCRTEYDWLGDVARRLGLWEAWSEGRESHVQWLEHLYGELRVKEPSLPPFARFKEQGGHTYPQPRTYIAYADQIRDPEGHPFATPSGKIELYSQRLHDMGDPAQIPALPVYVPCPEGPEDGLRALYPLQLIGWHTKRRTHSIHDNNAWMEEVEPQRLWIHPEDARPRGLHTGDVAEVFNDRGTVRVPVLVTGRIVQGTVALPQGAWYTPGPDGTDVRGSINVLTSSRPTPLAKGNPQHTNLVEVRAFAPPGGG